MLWRSPISVATRPTRRRQGISSIGFGGRNRNFLLSNLNVRWTISALQTFFDHGENDAQKTVGGMGFLYGNLIKVYESEHSLFQDNAETEGPLKVMANEGFPSLGSFSPGQDILRNINLAALAAAQLDDVAGPLLMLLLSRSQRQKTIFHRVDQMVRTSQPRRADALRYLSFGEVLRSNV